MKQILSCFLALCAAASAQEPVPPLADADALVAELGSEVPAVRQKAREELRKLRRRAIPALTTGAKSEDLEVQATCQDLLALLHGAEIVFTDGAPPAGTPWWKARSAKVSVDFRDTPVEEVLSSLEEASGRPVKRQSGAPLADRRITLRLKDGPLEFLLGWILRHGAEGNFYGSARLGWGDREILFSYDANAAKDKTTVDYARADALAGLSEADQRSLAGLLEGMLQVEGATNAPMPKLGDTALKFTAPATLQTEAARLVDDLRRFAAGEPALGADLDAAAAELGKKVVNVSFQSASYEDAFAEIERQSGARVVMDPRIEQWTRNDVYYQSGGDKPASVVMGEMFRHYNMIRVEQRWGAWWVTTDAQGYGERSLWIRPARDFWRTMMAAEKKWQPGDIEGWLRAFQKNQGRNNAAAARPFMDLGVFVLYGPRSASDAVEALMEGRRAETERRRSRLEGREVPAADAMTAARMEERLLDRLGRDRIQVEHAADGFRDDQAFSQVFSSLHEVLGVSSTSGSVMGAGRKESVRACRLHDVTPRVLWHWMNRGTDFYLEYRPDEKRASYGIGMKAPREGFGLPSFGQGRVHEEYREEFAKLLETWSDDARKAWRDAPALSFAPAGNAVRLPREGPEVLFSLAGMDGSAVNVSLVPSEPPEWLGTTVAWPGGALAVDEVLAKLGELGKINYILDLPRNARATKKTELPAKEMTVREVLDGVTTACGVGWSVREEGVVWVTGGSEVAVWISLPDAAVLGAEEFAAAAENFSRTGDQVFAFAPVGRIFARCAPERASGASGAFRAAIAAARAAAATEAAALTQAGIDGEVPAGLAGAMALEAAAVSSPAVAFRLAERVQAGGYDRQARARFLAVALDAGASAELATRARARAARLTAIAGVSEPQLDADADTLASQVLEDAAAPAEARKDALLARAEVLRRAGRVEEALAAYRELGQLGLDSEDSRRWQARLEGLK